MVELGEPCQSSLAEQRQMDREGERAQSRIGADIARRLLAPDMLLARRQGQHPAAPASRVERLSDEATRHLADEPVASGEEPDMRAAEIQRVTEGLAFSRDNVRAHFARRSNGTE